MKITTKTGDNGETGLFGGRRVSKASGFIELVGELDELQAVIGWCRVEAGGEAAILDHVADDIYRMMAIVGFEFKCPKNIQPICDKDVEFLENEMAKYEQAVGNLNKFVRPGSSEISARLHIARTVCRRVERRVAGMIENMKKKLDSDNSPGIDLNSEAQKFLAKILKYFNRLSDLLFVMTQ